MRCSSNKLNIIVYIIALFAISIHAANAQSTNTITIAQSGPYDQDLRVLIEGRGGYCGFLFAQCLDGYKVGLKLQGKTLEISPSGRNPAHDWCVKNDEVQSCMLLVPK